LDIISSSSNDGIEDDLGVRGLKFANDNVKNGEEVVVVDVNNDGNADIFVTEMLPSDPNRLKSVTTFEDWNKYQSAVEQVTFDLFDLKD
jgi:hypothetical protein